MFMTLTIAGAPGLVLPGSEGDPLAQGLVHALPVYAPVAGLCHIGEEGVLDDGCHGVGVGLARGARGDPEEAVLRVDGPQVA